MYIAKKALSRRTFLRGGRATRPLPLLDAMVPALSAASAEPAPRLGFIYVANGVIQKQWNPTTTGAGFELPPILKPLEPVRDHISVLSGLAHLQADTFGDGTCDSGDCFYINTVSWRNPTTPNPAETHPRIVFERLFGDGGSAAQRLSRVRETGSILDSVTEEVNFLAKTLGRSDRTKLSEYMDSVREIEQRIQNAESQAAHSIELPDRPVDVPDSFDEYTKMMLDLVALGYQADITRVFTMIFARELSSRTFAHIGVQDQHHAVSHHRDDPELIVKKAK